MKIYKLEIFKEMKVFVTRAISRVVRRVVREL
jgi:hypothetical protein